MASPGSSSRKLEASEIEESPAKRIITGHIPSPPPAPTAPAAPAPTAAAAAATSTTSAAAGSAHAPPEGSKVPLPDDEADDGRIWATPFKTAETC